MKARSGFGHTAFVCGALLLAVTCAVAPSAYAQKKGGGGEGGGEWTVINLHPSGASSSRAIGVGNGKQVGYADFDGVSRASMWSGSANSRVDLHPAGATSSRATVVEGSQQIGYSSFGASMWSGSAASYVDLHPEGYDFSFAMGIGDGMQVGYAGWAADGGPGVSHAGLWFGTPESWVDIHPEWAGATQSRIGDADGARQVGHVTLGGVGHASVWYGTADSWIDLHPAGAEFSYADGAGGGQIVGTARLLGGALHASLWTADTAASWVDLHPAGAYSSSQAYDAHGGQQIGYAFYNGAGTHGTHAGIWSGTPGSFVDLHPFASAKGFANSFVLGISHDATYTYVVGWGYNTKTKREEALMWRRRN